MVTLTTGSGAGVAAVAACSHSCLAGRPTWPGSSERPATSVAHGGRGRAVYGLPFRCRPGSLAPGFERWRLLLCARRLRRRGQRPRQSLAIGDIERERRPFVVRASAPLATGIVLYRRRDRRAESTGLPDSRSTGPTIVGPGPPRPRVRDRRSRANGPLPRVARDPRDRAATERAETSRPRVAPGVRAGDSAPSATAAPIVRGSNSEGRRGSSGLTRSKAPSIRRRRKCGAGASARSVLRCVVH